MVNKSKNVIPTYNIKPSIEQINARANQIALEDKRWRDKIKTIMNSSEHANRNKQLNKELYKLRLIEKLEKIYPFDVDVIFI